MSKATEVAKMLEAKIQEYWLTEPEDVTMLKNCGVRGAHRQPSPAILYCESETREMVDYLWYMINLVKQDQIDLKAAKTVTANMVNLKQNKWTNWYQIHKFCSICKEMILGIEAAETKEEFLAVLEPMQILVCKFNFWLDRCIPWMTLTTTFDWILEGKEN